VNFLMFVCFCKFQSLNPFRQIFRYVVQQVFKINFAVIDGF